MAKFQDLVGRDTRANQPAATAVSEGALYYVTDEQVLERSNGTIWQDVTPNANVANDSVTYAKLQNVSAASKLLGRGDSGAGDPQEITVGTGLTMTGTTLSASGGGGGGSLVLLEQHTAAGSASLDFTTAISATYDEYLIEFVNLVPSAAGAFPWLRMSTNGGVSYDSGANYSYDSFAIFASNFDIASRVAQTKIALTCDGTATGQPTTAGFSFSGSVRLMNPGSTSLFKQIIGQTYGYEASTPSRLMSTIQGAYEIATAVNALRVMYSTGNIASGTVRIYGVAK